MPDFVRSINKACVDHLSYILSVLIAGAGGILWVALVWGGAMGERVSANEERTKVALEQSQETRRAYQEMQGLIRQIAVDTAVIKERVEAGQ